jgi:hypothetical protein
MLLNGSLYHRRIRNASANSWKRLVNRLRQRPRRLCCLGQTFRYRWHQQRDLDLDIWYLDDAPANTARTELECIEAEVVFLTRQRFRQWPEFQTEIHFHLSQKFHRDAAKRIFDYLGKNANAMQRTREQKAPVNGISR